MLVLTAVIGVGGGLYWSIHHAQGKSSKPFIFHVGSGDTVTSIADRLSRKGIISNPLIFRLDARLQNLGNKLKVGDYSLRRNMSIDDMVTALTLYHDKLIRITVPPGFRAEQIAQRLQINGISARQFLAIVRHPDPALLKMSILRAKPANASLEGYLFPDTYEVSKHFSAHDFVRLMLTRMQQQFTPALRSQAAREGWSIHAVLTLASIVEREARAPDDVRTIASVYVNRLRDRTQVWKLNADPTVQYLLGSTRKWWPVLNLDPSTVSPNSAYNTYVHPGLPPGPIASPSLTSIQAVIDPAKTQYFYFVAKDDCRHSAFARTLQEQEMNQQKYHCQA